MNDGHLARRLPPFVPTAGGVIGRPSSSKSSVVATASRGEVLVKWRRYCQILGYWCPVEKGGIRGHADKSFLEKVPCPNG